MLILNVDRKSPTPVYRQIVDGVVRLVDGGTLQAGSRLPPSRVLARMSGVHRSTVTRAYEELWALGYLESRPGSYSTVRRRPRPVSASEPHAKGAIDWAAAVTPATRGVREAVLLLDRERHTKTPPGIIDFSRMTADSELAPADEVRRCFKSILVEQGGAILQYGHPSGYRPLREVIAGRLQTHGVAVSGDEVIITGGAQQAIDLALRALTRPGDTIAVESPTYAIALPLFRFHGLRLAVIPVRADGIDLDTLERRLNKERISLVYTVPSFQNPTGITTDQAHRERLLAMCEKHRVPILEDGFEEEMKYFGKAVLPVKSSAIGQFLRPGYVETTKPYTRAVARCLFFSEYCRS